MIETGLPLQSGGDILQTAIEVILSSTFFRWALLLFLVAFIGSLLSGLLDVALMVAQYGMIILICLGILEFIAPGILAAILDAAPL